MNTRLSIPGPRSLAATLDERDGDSVVVACPPHPQMRGDRHDSRLTAVSDALADDDIDCFRFDYGPWDEGRGERRDVRQALSWARERYERVGLFGFSFGGGMALLASVPDETAPVPDVVSVLAPAAQVTEGDEVTDALAAIACPVQILYGERDETAVWEPLVKRAEALGYDVEGLPADHFFVGQQQKVAAAVARFQADVLAEN
jgi:alpha/beta superfamily hydrolase